MINDSDHAHLHRGDQVVAEVGRQQLGVELEGGGPNLLDPGVTRHTRAVHVQYTCSTGGGQVTCCGGGGGAPAPGSESSARSEERREVRVWSGSLAFCCYFRGI